PDEACGLLVGPMTGSGEPTGSISEARPCRNADASAVTYTVDPRDMLAGMRAAAANGGEIVGVLHSHTPTAPDPLPTRVRQAVDPAWFYVLVSLRDGAPGLRCYRIRGETIAEVAVALDRG